MVNTDQKNASQSCRRHGPLPEHAVGQYRIPSDQNRIKDPASVHTVIGRLDHQLQNTVRRCHRQQFIAYPGNGIQVRHAHLAGMVKFFSIEPDRRGGHDLRNIQKIDLPRFRQDPQPVRCITEPRIPHPGPRTGQVNIFHPCRTSRPKILRGIQLTVIKLPLPRQFIHGRSKIRLPKVQYSLSRLRPLRNKRSGGSKKQSQAQAENQ